VLASSTMASDSDVAALIAAIDGASDARAARTEVVMRPNDEVERPDAGASRATRVQNSEARSRRLGTHLSRSAPTEVR
jgi:hypothetical protein